MFLNSVEQRSTQRRYEQGERRRKMPGGRVRDGRHVLLSCPSLVKSNYYLAIRH